MTEPSLTVPSQLVASRDAGFNQSLIQTFVQNDDISTAKDITAAPSEGKRIVATDILVSVDTACYLTILEDGEGGAVLAGLYMPANGSAQITLRGYLKGAAGKKLQMQSVPASKASCTCVYFEEA
jgi:hypothetical protein